MATANPVCYSCGETESELYYCETCSNLEESSNEKEVLCDLCVGPHIGSSHKVLTSKGQEPLICQHHRRLHNQYCLTCDVTFCAKCIKDHTQHKIGIMEERVIEIKKEVFEMMSKLESVEKPLRAKEESVSVVRTTHQTEQVKLTELFENEIEKARQVGSKESAKI